jgi:hypothetical protein
VKLIELDEGKKKEKRAENRNEGKLKMCEGIFEV